MSQWTTVRAPASSANLGPGFDTLGLALEIYLTCRFRRSDALKISVSGRDAEVIPTDATNMVWATAVRVAKDQGREMPPLEIDADNGIPLGKGLGSSAAALKLPSRAAASKARRALSGGPFGRMGETDIYYP